MAQTQHHTEHQVGRRRQVRRPGPRPNRRPGPDDVIDLDDLPPDDDLVVLDRTPSWTDPRFLVPLALFLAAVFVIGLALRANSISRSAAPAATTDELVIAIREAEARAGFGGVTVSNADGLIVLEGEVPSSADAAAIGAVARSVEGVERIDNRVVIVAGSVLLPSPSTVTPTDPPATLADRLAGAGNVTFQPASAEITAEGLAVVDAVASLLLAAPDIPVEIHGHTDSVGDSASNERLSQERAQAVVDALVARGVDGTRLTAVGFGESQPLEPNITDEGRAANRRIEFALRP